jgi:hypothetical protein
MVDKLNPITPDEVKAAAEQNGISFINAAYTVDCLVQIANGTNLGWNVSDIKKALRKLQVLGIDRQRLRN